MVYSQGVEEMILDQMGHEQTLPIWSDSEPADDVTLQTRYSHTNTVVVVILTNNCCFIEALGMRSNGERQLPSLYQERYIMVSEIASEFG